MRVTIALSMHGNLTEEDCGYLKTFMDHGRDMMRHIPGVAVTVQDPINVTGFGTGVLPVSGEYVMSEPVRVPLRAFCEDCGGWGCTDCDMTGWAEGPGVTAVADPVPDDDEPREAGPVVKRTVTMGNTSIAEEFGHGDRGRN